MSRILGIDYGEKRIGVAVSDPTNTFAQPYTTLENKSQEYVFTQILKIAEEKDVARIVIGLPGNMNGTIGPKAREAMRFAEKLQDITHLPVVTWDERLSTSRAYTSLAASGMSLAKKKKKIDKMAAQFILQNYMDFTKSRKEDGPDR